MRAQLEQVERLSERLPPLVFRQLLDNSLADLDATLNAQLKALTSTDAEFEQRRVSLHFTSLLSLTHTIKVISYYSYSYNYSHSYRKIVDIRKCELSCAVLHVSTVKRIY